jgi:hypothetical protein
MYFCSGVDTDLIVTVNLKDFPTADEIVGAQRRRPQPATHSGNSIAIERMKAEGFEPAVVIETSSNNFQAWLNHGQALDAAASTRAAKALVERFGGDPSSADRRHFGRLVGFTIRNRSGSCRQGCGHLRGCGQLPGGFIRGRRSSLRRQQK